jgi:putative transposase
MAQSLASTYLHLVFSTKGRSDFIREPRVREELHTYMGGVLNNHKCQSLGVGGVSDHVHLAFRLGKTVSISEIVKEVKVSSSIWMKSHVPNFAWQSGYGAYSIGPSDVDALQAYIRDQEQHHKKFSFQEEYRQIMREQGMGWDEKYVWD